MSNIGLDGGAGTFLIEHMSKSTQWVGGCSLNFQKACGTFFIRKIIRFQKIFGEGQKFSGERRGWGFSGKILKSIMVLILISFAEGVFWENFEKYHGTFSHFISVESENLSKKRRGWGGLLEKFQKVPWYFFLFFHSQRRWVLNLKNFEKPAYVPSKKNLRPWLGSLFFDDVKKSCRFDSFLQKTPQNKVPRSITI